MPWDGIWHPKTILVAIVVTVLYAFTVSFLWIAITGPSGAEPTRAENSLRTPAPEQEAGQREEQGYPVSDERAPRRDGPQPVDPPER